jgi:hypothetical protein
MERECISEEALKKDLEDNLRGFGPQMDAFASSLARDLIRLAGADRAAAQREEARA